MGNNINTQRLYCLRMKLLNEHNARWRDIYSIKFYLTGTSQNVVEKGKKNEKRKKKTMMLSKKYGQNKKYLENLERL